MGWTDLSPSGDVRELGDHWAAPVRYEREGAARRPAQGHELLWHNCRVLSRLGRSRKTGAGNAGVHLRKAGGGGASG